MRLCGSLKPQSRSSVSSDVGRLCRSSVSGPWRWTQNTGARLRSGVSAPSRCWRRQVDTISTETLEIPDPDVILAQVQPGSICDVQLGGLYNLTQGPLTVDIASSPINEIMFTSTKPSEYCEEITLQEIGKCRPCCVVRVVAGYLVEVVPGTTGRDHLVMKSSPLLVEPDNLNGLLAPTMFVTGQRRIVDCRRFVVDTDAQGQTVIMQYGILRKRQFQRLLELLKQY